jgi:hypothetical protein
LRKRAEEADGAESDVAFVIVGAGAVRRFDRYR